MGIEKLSDFVYSKTKRNKSLNKGGPTIMKKKKLISLLLVASMAFSLAACGSSGGDDKDADKGGDEKTLKVAAVETAYGADMWKEVCSAFEKSHEGVKVELTIDKKLEDVINPQMKSGEYPDVILRAVGAESGITETFVKDNNLVDLTDVLDMTVPGEEVTVGDKILPGFVENTITNPYGDGKTYLMPMFYGPCGLFYNAGLFEEKGWDVPTTWDEMWALGDKAKEEGIALFTYPTTGYFDAFFYALMHETMGDDFSKALTYEDGIWDTEGAKQAFDIVAKLATYTEKTTPANANDNDFRKNQQLVLDNKALFMPNGNWVIGEMEDAPRADGFEWGFTALPAVKEGGERASYTFFEQIWMPAEAKEQDLGKEFIAYLYSDEAAKIFFDKGGAVQPIEGMSDMITDDNTKLYYSIYDTGAVAVMDAFAATEPIEGLTTRSTFFDPVNSLVTGDKTEQDWIDQIKAGNPITVTEPNMTRFIMSLEEAVDLVLYAFEHGENGDLLIMKAPACSIGLQAEAVCEMFGGNKDDIKVIGIRHGEKMYETLLTNEECAKAVDLGDFYRVPADNRGLNYDKYFKEGDVKRNKLTEFNSNNTKLLNKEEIKAKMMELTYIQGRLAEE